MKIRLTQCYLIVLTPEPYIRVRRKPVDDGHLGHWHAIWTQVHSPPTGIVWISLRTVSIIKINIGNPVYCFLCFT